MKCGKSAMTKKSILPCEKTQIVEKFMWKKHKKLTGQQKDKNTMAIKIAVFSRRFFAVREKKHKRLKNQVWTKEICHGRLVSKKCHVLYDEFIVCEKTQKVENQVWTRKIAMADSYLNLPRQRKSCKLNCHDLRTKFSMINKLNLPWLSKRKTYRLPWECCKKSLNFPCLEYKKCCGFTVWI